MDYEGATSVLDFEESSTRSTPVAPAFDLSKSYAITGLTSSALLQTVAGGGESGDPAGFGVVLLYQLLASAAERIFGRYTTGQGYVVDRSASAHTVSWYVVDGGGTLRNVTINLPAASAFGQIIALILRHNATTIDGWVYGQAKPTPVAITGITVSTQPQQLRGSTGATSAPLGMLTYRGVASDAQLVDVLNAARALGDLPTKAAAEALMPGITVAHRYSVREELAKGRAVVTGQIAPASLSDSVTDAASDLMTRSGLPTVRVLDPNTYPRTLHGILGASAACWLETAAGAGIRGSAAGFYVIDVIRPQTLTGTQMFACCLNDAGNRGWFFQSLAGVLYFRAESSGGAETASAGYTLSAADVGAPLWVAGQVTASGVVRLHVRGAQVGADSAPMTFGPAASDVPMRVGVWKAATPQNTDSTWMGLAGGPDASPAELLTAFNAFLSTGRVVGVPGKTEHAYDPTIDVSVSGPSAGVPAQVLDRSGTDHLARVGGITASAGLSKFSTVQLAQTSGVVTPGVATGFYAECLVDVATLSGQQGYFAATSDAGFTNGFVLANNAGKLNVWGGGGTVAAGANLALGRRHLALRHDGSTLRAYVDGVSVGTSASYTHVPTTVATTIGGIRASSILWPMTSDRVRGAAYGPGVVSDGQIAAAAAAAIAAGKCVGIAGVTTKMWNAVDDIADAGGIVPLRLVERISGSLADAVQVVNPKLEVSTRTERMWNWETTPTMIGGRNWSSANYFSGPMTGFGNSAAMPYWFMIALIVHAKTGSASQYFFSKGLANAQQGFHVYGQSTWGSIGMSHGLGGGSVVAPSFSIATTDLGRVLILGYQWTGAVVQAFAQRAKNGADVVAATYSPYAGNLMIGRNADTTVNPASDAVTVLDAMGGAGFLTLPEYQSAHDAFLASEVFAPVTGKTARWWSMKRTANANGGALATLTDQMGSGESLALVGSPSISTMYHHP